MKFFKAPYLYTKYLSKSIFYGRNKNSIYLTFDDGPTPEVTQFVLSELKKYNAKASFFCIGDKILRYPEIFQLIKNEGHSIGNHTYNHLNGWTNQNNNYFDNIDKCNEIVNSKLFRPPYGKLKKSQETHLSSKYEIVLWSLLTYDFVKNLSIDKTLNSLSKKTNGGEIVVFHDSEKAFENIKLLLPRYLDFCSKKGFVFEAL